MKPLPHNNCIALLSAIKTIYSIRSIEQFPSGVLSSVRKVVPCTTMCYNDVRVPDYSIFWVSDPADSSPSPKLKEAFICHLSEHPVMSYYRQTGDNRSLRISDLLTQRQFRKLALYNEYYRLRNVEYQLVSIISLGPDRITGFALDRDVADFTEDERLSLNLIGPHLAEAYQNVQTLDLMKRAVEERGRKLVIVSWSGQVRLAEDAVWQMIGRFFDVPPYQKSLPNTLSNWINHERSRFSDDSDVPTPSVPLVINKDSHRLTVHFWWGGQTAEHDMLLMEEKLLEPAHTLWEDPRLTRRETEILAWLSQGKTNAEIGLALSISPRTVKKHLEHIYSKLKIHRRSAAVARSYHL